MYSSISKQNAHNQSCKIGVIITNLGTPSAPTKNALKTYLREFLSDPRVVELPRWLWTLILEGVILNLRPRRSAKAYAKVWTADGSPLDSIMRSLTAKLVDQMHVPVHASNLRIDYAMRYGKPSIEDVVLEMQADGVQRIIALPLYPQYSASTTASTFDEFARVFAKMRWQPSLDFLPPYYDNPDFVTTIAQSIQSYRAQNGAGQLLLFSYHGLPQRYLHKGDPYHCQCLKTSRLVQAALNLPDAQVRTFFQSRFGREPWLQPYLTPSLTELGKQGFKNIDIICPGFSIDCLETLEEIKMEAQQTFVDAGGETLNYIPCLNSSEEHIELLVSLLNPSIKHHLQQISQPEKRLLSANAIKTQELTSPNRKVDGGNSENKIKVASEKKKDSTKSDQGASKS